ncbi:MAG: hypothetical protein N2312_02320, partial [Dictyoglomaceae bacterium]|nr:hypothetical protein [Dictyoglomaceae bacterium]
MYSKKKEKNKYYFFRLNSHGTFDLYDKINKIELKNKGFLKVINLKGEITLPEGADGNKRSVNKISMPFCITYTLYRDFPRVDVSIEMKNKSKDHRLRFGIDLEEEIDKVINDGYFGIVEHPTKLEKDKDYI